MTEKIKQQVVEQKGPSIFDIINGLNQFADRIKALAERVREDKPEAAGYLDEAQQSIGGAYIALNNYLDSLV